MAASMREMVHKNIMARCSVRSYAPGVLDRAAVTALLEAAVRAPTAMHTEPWAFVIVQDGEKLKRISDTARPMFAESLHRAHMPKPLGGDADILHGAGTLIVICARPSSPFVGADCWLAAENLMLMASAMGLGSCVIGSAQEALNTAGIKAMLGIPEAYEAIVPVIVGVPAGDAPASPRNAPMVLAWD